MSLVSLITRGQLEQGLKYLFLVHPVHGAAPNALLVTNTTPFLIAIILVVSSIHIFYLQPQAWRKEISIRAHYCLYFDSLRRGLSAVLSAGNNRYESHI